MENNIKAGDMVAHVLKPNLKMIVNGTSEYNDGTYKCTYYNGLTGLFVKVFFDPVEIIPFD